MSSPNEERKNQQHEGLVAGTGPREDEEPGHLPGPTEELPRPEPEPPLLRAKDEENVALPCPDEII
ncbi:MAG TPA: hypothetical protein VGN08_12770 [Solirubrobacteraceae bacterium]|jgi:hypothetical protein